MEAFIRSNKAIWLMLFADFLAVLGWFIVKANGGNEGVLGRSKSVGRVLHINNLPDFWVPVKGFLRKTIQKVR
jgi:hypothetical protein